MSQSPPPTRANATRSYSADVDIGTKLFAKVRASTPPHPDELANELYAVQMKLREALSSPRLTVAKFLGPLLLAPSMLYPPLFVGLASASVVGLVGLAVRSSRRGAEVRQFMRNAQIGHSRAIEPGATHATIRIEITDGDRTFTARIPRSWSRATRDEDMTKMPTLFAPHSNIVIAQDARGQLLLGEIEEEPLPRATLRR